MKRYTNLKYLADGRKNLKVQFVSVLASVDLNLILTFMDALNALNDA